MKRRDVLKSIGTATLLGTTFSSCTSGSLEENNQKTGLETQPERVLRLAHITDVHVQPEDGAPEGFEKCLHHIQSLQDSVDIIFNGGDCIMDALGKEKSRVQTQWELWQSIIKSEAGLPVVNCIGNHDVWGAGPESDPLYGKSWAQDELALNQRYQSFEQAGWHFIVLDSTHPNAEGGWYTAKLDEEQYDWLQTDLQQVDKNTPVMVFSHIPIVAACAYFDGENEKSGDWRVPGAWMHIDARDMVELFHRHHNVKLCLSGHIHLLDEVVYNGVTYMCNGAVSGNWWNPKPYHQTKAGYAVMNLYKDGSFDREYIHYQEAAS